MSYASIKNIMIVRGLSPSCDGCLKKGDGMKKIALFSVCSIVVANMIGAGVFTSLGFQTQVISSPFSLVFLWVVGGLIALCGALSYGELASSMPHSGGEYFYLSKIYHPILGFLSGWTSSTVAFAAPIALALRLSSEYVCYIFSSLNPLWLSVILSVLLTLIHMSGLKFGSLFQNISTGLKIFLILAFIVFGFLHGPPMGHSLSFLPREDDLNIILSSNFAVSLVFVMYAYSGWNASIYIADEIQNPKRTIPFSLFSSTLFVMILYVLINTVILLTVPMENLKGALEVAFLSADVIFGVLGSQFMSILLAITLISSASSMVWTGPRVTQEMSKKIRSLRIFCSYKDNRPPLKGLCLQLLITLIMLFTSSFKQILTYIGFIVTLFSFLAVLGVFIYRYRFGKIKESCTTFAYHITPLIFLFGSGWMMFYLCLYETKETLLGVLTLCIGGVFYFFSQRNRKLK